MYSCPLQGFVFNPISEIRRPQFGAMEQAGYWMWTKRKHSLSSHFQSSNTYDDSWEEQAFAEDAAGSLGGCVWPPRSYSCSFCRREFRSAQALGGHMNVHRRDRARLKQSPSPQNEIHHHDPYQNNSNHLKNPFASLSFQYPPQVCTLVYNPNPNSDLGSIASPSSPSRVSAPPTQENSPEKTFLPPFSSPKVQDHHKRSPTSSPQSWSNSVAERCYQTFDLKNEGEKNSRVLEAGCRQTADYLKTDLSVSMNLVVRRTHSNLSDEKGETVSCKRRRTEASSLPFFLKPSSIDDKHGLQSEQHELGPSSIEDLDLELRLGDPPKVK
ncbi:hypothetical protein Pint_35366 [Pistacia integerrima]|uniref:Uncharacterized protein n=1 Tax=Pistacia integerrima TaxID=434235 RepID=A0ACC0XZ70_9ROSI|nr:hypothetical protein Pint_35366 [Pistacia integerrima]